MQSSGTPAQCAMPRWIRILVHWTIAAALVLHLFSCAFLGVNHVPLN